MMGLQGESATGVKPKPSAGHLVLVAFLIVVAARIYSLGLWRPQLLVMGLVYGSLSSLPFAGVCLIPQLFIPRRFKSAGLLRVTVFILPAVLLAAWMVVSALPSSHIRAILDGQHFARLPTSATAVKVEGWAAGFGHESWLRFKATTQDVEAFLANSPVLNGLEPEHFGSDRMLVRPPRDDAADPGKYAAMPHEVLELSPYARDGTLRRSRKAAGGTLSWDVWATTAP